MDAFVSLISTVGFPIAVAIALGWFVFQIYKRSEKREDEFRAEITKSQEINAEAIKTIALYADRLDIIQRDVNEIKEDIIILTEHLP